MNNSCLYCDKKVIAKKLCERHYRLQRQGREMDTPERYKSPIEVTHPVYRAWTNMKTRCNNPNSTQWKWYGERGIHYCEEWEDFENFYNDMFVGWRPGLMLDRKENNGNYDPLNCRWVPPGLSAVNRRRRGTA